MNRGPARAIGQHREMRPGWFVVNDGSRERPFLSFRYTSFCRFYTGSVALLGRSDRICGCCDALLGHRLRSRDSNKMTRLERDVSDPITFPLQTNSSDDA